MEVTVLASTPRPAGVVDPGRRPWAVRLPLGAVVLALGWLLAWAPSAAGQAPTVLVTRVAGPITPVVADQLADGVRAAERDGHTALLVELDTPVGWTPRCGRSPRRSSARGCRWWCT
jgi:hypothetical protein